VFNAINVFGEHGFHDCFADRFFTNHKIPAKAVEDEGRCLVVGKIGSKHWSAVITYRGDALRIISVRRSREREVEYYESSRI
jgi:uncharacterized DUF497 family protein